MTLRRLLLGLVLTVLLGVAGTMTAARLLELRGGPWVRLVAFTPYALPLYGLATLLLLVVWWRGHGFWSGTARVLTAAALGGVVVHAAWASGPYLGTAPVAAPTEGAREVRVMTSNLHVGRADPARVVGLAVTRRVDVLVLQEVTPQGLAGLREAGIGRAFGHRAGRPAAGATGTMVFSRTRLRAVRRLPTPFGSYAMDVRLARVPDAPGGRVHLLAVHPRPPIGADAGWRADQVAVRRAARGLTGPTVVAGDLNATMDHAPMRELVGRGFRDAATEARSRWQPTWQPTWPSAGLVARFGVTVPPLVAIDHVLVAEGLRAVATRTYPVRGTDHRALVATLSP